MCYREKYVPFSISVEAKMHGFCLESWLDCLMSIEGLGLKNVIIYTRDILQHIDTLC